MKKVHRFIWFAGSNPSSMFSRKPKNEEKHSKTEQTINLKEL